MEQIGMAMVLLAERKGSVPLLCHALPNFMPEDRRPETFTPVTLILYPSSTVTKLFIVTAFLGCIDVCMNESAHT